MSKAFARLAPALLLVLPLALAAPASADRLTLGSDLSADATLVEAHGADTAFWPLAIDGAAVTVPADGQVVQIRVKGAAMRERGAGDPANMVHFQSLEPAAADGSRTVYLTSAFADMPIDTPDAITSFEPENLCVHQGGSVAFNTIGGFGWAGGDPFHPNPVPDNPPYYKSGTPWRIFATAPRSATAWYSKDNGTNNGQTLVPRGGSDALSGHGAVLQGQELLMQVIVATGDDRSEPCGGPRRHPDGSLVQTGPDPAYMKVVTAGGKPQQPYVTKNRRFSTGIYCGGEAVPVCTGTATMLIGKRVAAKRKFSVPALSTGKVAMRLSKKLFRKLDRSKRRKLRVTYVLTTSFGTYRSKLTLKR